MSAGMTWKRSCLAAIAGLVALAAAYVVARDTSESPAATPLTDGVPTSAQFLAASGQTGEPVSREPSEPSAAARAARARLPEPDRAPAPHRATEGSTCTTSDVLRATCGEVAAGKPAVSSIGTGEPGLETCSPAPVGEPPRLVAVRAGRLACRDAQALAFRYVAERAAGLDGFRCRESTTDVTCAGDRGEFAFALPSG